jgi:predicted phosphoribosyltransferase
MESPIETVVVERRGLRGLTRVFRDRAHAGAVLAEMLSARRGSNALILAVPAGGVPVAVEIAACLRLELDVAVVSKITLPWNTEAGYGAVAFDGSTSINRALTTAVGLSEAQIEAGVEATREKVARRAERLRGDRPAASLEGRPVIVVDDGLASGYTMMVAVRVLRASSPERLVVAVPTAPADTVDRLAERVDALYCANIREGRPFAVAQAYQRWSDVSEEAAIELLSRTRAVLS